MSSELLVDYGEDAATAQLGQLKLSTIEDQQWPPDESTLSKSGETMFSNYYCLKEPSSVLPETFRIFLLQLQKLHTQKRTPALFLLWYIFVLLQRQTSPSHLMLAHRTFPGTTPFMTSPDIKLLKWQVCRSLHPFLYISSATTSPLFLYFLHFTVCHFLQSQKCLQHDKYTAAQKIGNIFLRWKWSVFVHDSLCVSRWW